MKPITIILVLIGCILFENSSSNHTESLRSRDSPLTRRVRALIFPNKASVLLTAALTKIIVGGRPSGLQYILEFDMYIPLPDTVQGWRPNILLGSTTKKPTAVKPKRRWDWYRHGYINRNSYHNPYKKLYTRYIWSRFLLTL